jgi:hypothetical protein
MNINWFYLFYLLFLFWRSNSNDVWNCRGLCSTCLYRSVDKEKLAGMREEWWPFHIPGITTKAVNVAGGNGQYRHIELNLKFRSSFNFFYSDIPACSLNKLESQHCQNRERITVFPFISWFWIADKFAILTGAEFKHTESFVTKLRYESLLCL